MASLWYMRVVNNVKNIKSDTNKNVRTFYVYDLRKLCYGSAVYMPVVCPSDCLIVCPPQVGLLSIRLNVL